MQNPPGTPTIGAQDAFALHQKAVALVDGAYDLVVLTMQSDAYQSDPEIREAAQKLWANIDASAVLRRR